MAPSPRPEWRLLLLSGYPHSFYSQPVPWMGEFKILYNSEAFVCVQTWSAGHNESAIPYAATVFSILKSFVAPFLFITLMNWSVLKTANYYLQADRIQVGTHADSGHQLQERARRISERKAAVNVWIIIAGFVLCYLPKWMASLCSAFLKTQKLPAMATQITGCLFFLSSLRNPIIYSIRKRGFRAGVKNVFRRIGVCGSANRIKQISVRGRVQKRQHDLHE